MRNKISTEASKMEQKDFDKAAHKYAATNLRKEQTEHYGDLEVYGRKKFLGLI